MSVHKQASKIKTCFASFEMLWFFSSNSPLLWNFTEPFLSYKIKNSRNKYVPCVSVDIFSITCICFSFQEAVTLDPKVARHLLLVFGLIAVTILTIVLVLKKFWEKYSEWKDCKESLKRPTKVAPFEEVSVAQKVFKAKTAKKVYTPPRDIFDDV